MPSPPHLRLDKEGRDCQPALIDSCCQPGSQICITISAKLAGFIINKLLDRLRKIVVYFPRNMSRIIPKILDRQTSVSSIVSTNI